MKKRDDKDSTTGSVPPKGPASPPSSSAPSGDTAVRFSMAPTTALSSKPELEPLPSGSIRVRAKKTALVGGMARIEGEVFSMSADEFEARKERDEFERL